MKAITQDTYGSPDDVLELRDIDTPAIKRDEVLLEVHAASVAGDDWHLVRGEPYAARLVTGLRKPRHRVPGRDVAGRVLAVGSAVTEFGPGDEVFGWCAGAFAEHVAVPAANLGHKPVNLTLAQAAVVPVSGLTALQAVRDAGRVRPHQHVLVIGASGGVGTFAVQTAKAFGARVTGVCSTTNTDLVRSIGADHVIDYTLEDFAQRAGHYDVIIDLVGNRSLADLRRALTRRGTLVLIGGAGGQWFKGTHRFLGALLLSPFVRHRLRPLVHRGRARDLATLQELIEAGKLTPVVSAHFGLAEVPDAIRHFANGHARGKVAITI
ncbi:MAG: NAD(P)-dependent alcohol dehydrogenase [Actinomycetota bacterium]|nr:NAD(P)-dependent alcohol dehydrogenase [Actinomycetota bacterium]